MFIEKLMQKNPKLIDATIKLYPFLEPNTYIIDLDMVKQNTKHMVREAKKQNITLYQMTKQFGRNPLVAKAIAKRGIPKVVAVDPWEAMVMIKNNIALGNVGHLVQCPQKFIEPIVKSKPDVLTVFTLEKAKQISQVAIKNNLIQNILVKVVGKNDVIYPGQEGGVKIQDLKKFIKDMEKLPGIKLIGATSFPCFLYDYDSKQIKKTNNVETLHEAIKIAKEMGLKFSHINMPSANCTESINLIAKNEGTHGEPGHSLTGTTPSNAVNNHVEIPAMVYVSEISHIYNNKAYFFGGGHYNRSRMENIILISGKKQIVQKTLPHKLDAIDYYLAFEIKDTKPQVSDIVIGAFRAQVFTTRSKVAVVSGIQDNNPKIEGIYTSLGVKDDK